MIEISRFIIYCIKFSPMKLNKQRS